MKKNSLDINSIHFKLLIYFMLLATALILMIGGMEIFVFNEF